MTRKNRYQAMVATYEKRRQKVKEVYSRRVGKLSYKIKLWKREIRRIEKRHERIEQIATKVEEFTGRRTKNSSPRRESLLARKLLFKYGLENGVRGVDLAEYVNCDLRNPARSRRTFNKEIGCYNETKDFWLRFKAFMDEGNL